MTTITPDKLEELERIAWSEYRDGLRDLRGRDYEDAEDASWEELQRTLADVAAERAELESAA